MQTEKKDIYEYTCSICKETYEVDYPQNPPHFCEERA